MHSISPADRAVKTVNLDKSFRGTGTQIKASAYMHAYVQVIVHEYLFIENIWLKTNLFIENKRTQKYAFHKCFSS